MWECIRTMVNFAADLAAVMTAGVAVAFWIRVVRREQTRRAALESYLREEKEAGDDAGFRSILHLVSNLSMTEAQIYDAAFSSELVSAVPVTGKDSKIAQNVMFVYKPPKARRYFSR